MSSFINQELLQSRADRLRARMKPPLCPCASICQHLGSGVREGIVEVKGSHSPWQEELPSAGGAGARGFAAVFVAGGCGAESASPAEQGVKNPCKAHCLNERRGGCAGGAVCFLKSRAFNYQRAKAGGKRWPGSCVCVCSGEGFGSCLGMSTPCQAALPSRYCSLWSRMMPAP